MRSRAALFLSISARARRGLALAPAARRARSLVRRSSDVREEPGRFSSAESKLSLTGFL